MNKKCHSTFADIVLDDDKTRYQAGEDVSGVIKFDLKGLTTMANIKLCLICVSEVEWDEIENNVIFRATYSHHDKIKLIEQTFPLHTKCESLSKGEHEVPFTIKLPDKGIPSSFVGPHGSIKYFIEVYNQEPLMDEVHRLGLCEFRVDVPSDHNLSVSIGCSKEKDFGLLSLDSGKILLDATLLKKGWAPGESIELHVSIHNESNVDVTPRAILYGVQVYMCDEQHKALQIQLSEAIVGKKVEEFTKSTETLVIPTPEDTPLTIKSPLISVKYFVHVTLDIPHAFNIHVDVPVVVTIPLSQNVRLAPNLWPHFIGKP